MDDIILIAGCVGVIAYYIGYHVRNIQMMKLLASNPEHFISVLEKVKSINTEIDKGMPEDKIPVAYEVHNSYYYAFNQISGEFLGQGPTLNEALEMASKRFPGKKFWCDTLAKDAQST